MLLEKTSFYTSIDKWLSCLMDFLYELLHTSVAQRFMPKK